MIMFFTSVSEKIPNAECRPVYSFGNADKLAAVFRLTGNKINGAVHFKVLHSIHVF